MTNHTVYSTTKSTKILSIYYVDSPCGTYKTTSALKELKKFEHDSNTIIVTKAKVLQNQIKSDALSPKSIYGFNSIKNFTIINDDENTSTATSQLIHWIDSVSDKIGNHVTITYKLYVQVRALIEKIKSTSDNSYKLHHNFNILIDEIPNIDEYSIVQVKAVSEVLHKHVRATYASSDKIMVLEFKDDSILKNVDESGLSKRVIKLLYDIANPYVKVQVLERDWNAKVMLYALNMVQPTLFFNTTIMGANFTKSTLYHYYSKLNIAFMDNTSISRHLCTTTIKKLNVLSLVDVTSSSRNNKKYKIRNSKYFYERITVNNMMVIDEMMDIVNTKIKSKSLLIRNNWNDNKINDNFIDIPVDSRGLNAYDDINNLCFFAALNRTPIHLEMMDELNFNRDVLYFETVETLYQAVYRTSLRTNGDSAITVAVATSDIALMLIGFGEHKSLDLIELKQKQLPKRIQDKIGAAIIRIHDDLNHVDVRKLIQMDFGKRDLVKYRTVIMQAFKDYGFTEVILNLRDPKCRPQTKTYIVDDKSKLVDTINKSKWNVENYTIIGGH